MIITIDAKNENSDLKFPCLMVHKDSPKEIIIVKESCGEDKRDIVYTVLSSDDYEKVGNVNTMGRIALLLWYRPFLGKITLENGQEI